MGFDEGRIVLDDANGIYYAGQTVRGNLIFEQEKVKSFRGIYVHMVGSCKVHWTTTERHTVNGKTETRHINHDSYEEYVNMKYYLAGGESGTHELKPGSYNYPFSFHIPPECPPTIDGEYGRIKYEIKVVVDRPWKFDQEKKVAVNVVVPLDLNANPYCKSPIELTLGSSYSCCCFYRGAMDTVVNVPVSGYCPQQIIPIEITCTNRGSVDIDSIKIRIIKETTFIATHRSGVKFQKEVIAQIKKSEVPGDTTRNWTVQIEVPSMPIYNLDGCKYISIEYKLEVVVSPEGCHSNSSESRKIILGTIPLRDYQGAENPPQIIIPEMSSYPVQTSYFPGNLSKISPYSSNSNINNPDQNLPYPTQNLPHTVQNLPYPTQNLPYAGQNLPYPTQNLPYPGQNLPHLGQNLPNLGQNLQYPAQNIPYPTGSATNLSYLSNSYPNNPPPYPGNPVQNMTEQNRGVSSRNTGFNDPGSNAPTPNNPFQGATAPSPFSS